MKLSFGKKILVKDKEEADFIWKKLLSNGYEWSNHLKNFNYYKELPIVIFVRHNKKLTYSNYKHEYKYGINYTIDDFKRLIFLDLE